MSVLFADKTEYHPVDFVRFFMMQPVSSIFNHHEFTLLAHRQAVFSHFGAQRGVFFAPDDERRYGNLRVFFADVISECPVPVEHGV